MRHTSLIMASVAILNAGTALAHTELAATVPPDAAMIAEAPKNVELRFSEPVRLTALSIQKGEGKKQSLGPLPSETTETFSVALLPAIIDDGHYVVAWRALSEDTHVMSGEFVFAVGAESSHDAHMNHEDMPAGEHHGEHAGAH